MSNHYDDVSRFLLDYREAEQQYLLRNWRVQGWRDSATMAGRYLVPDEGINVMANLPYTTIKVAVALASRNRQYVRGVSRNETKAEKELTAQKEYLVMAGLEEADRFGFIRGHDLFRHELAQSIFVDGWLAIDSLLDLTERGRYMFPAKVLDIIDVFPKYSDNDMEKVYTRSITTVGDAEKRYDVKLGPDPNELVSIISCWYWYNDEVWNTVVACSGKNPKSFRAPMPRDSVGANRVLPYFGDYTSEVVLRHERDRLVKSLPVVVAPVGGAHWRKQAFTPTKQYDGMTYYEGVGISNEDEWGHSLLYSIDHLLATYNDMVSSLHELVDTYIHPTVLVKTPNGRVKEIKLGKDNYLATGEAVEILWMQGNAPPFDYVMKLVERFLDEGTLPAAVRSGPSDVQSGYALGFFDGVAHNHLVRGINAKDAGMSEVARQWLEQYELGGAAARTKAASLWGIDPSGKNFIVKPPGNLDGFYGIYCETELATPQNLLARANYISILRGAGIITEETGREIARIADPQREGDNLTVEQVMRNPQIQMAVALAEMVARKNMTAAAALAQQLGVPLMTASGLVGPNGRPITQPNPRTGLPARPLPRPEALPPNASQGPPLPEMGTVPAGMSTGNPTAEGGIASYLRGIG